MTLTGRGVWSANLRFGDPDDITKAATELDKLGYTAAWLPDAGGPLFEALERVLDATTNLVAASGVLNVWHQPAESTVAWWDGLADARRERVMLGIGVSHAPMIGEQWRRPIDVMNRYLDALDEGGVPGEHRCLAALGPKMLGLARDRAAGAHPYLVTPDHTAEARSILGDKGLFVEQGVVLETDAARAREVARVGLDHYFGLPNYTNNWRRLGFTDDDIATRSDRLVDALIAWGDDDAVEERIAAHHAAGADHVCIQVIQDFSLPMPRDAWRTLAPS